MVAATATTIWKKASAEESIQGRNDVQRGLPKMKLEPGEAGKFRKNRIRIFPPRADAPTNRWYQTWALHYINGRPVPCSDFHNGQACRLCMLQSQLYRDGDKAKSDQIRVKYYGLMNAVKVLPDGRALKVNTEGIITDEPARVEVLQLSWPTMTDLLNAIEEELPRSEQDVSDPESGRTVVIKRKGSNQTETKYQVELGEQGEFNGGDFSLLEGMFDLTTAFTFPTDDILTGLIEGPAAKQLPAARVAWDDDDDDDDDDKPPFDLPASQYRVVDDDDEVEPAAKKPMGRPKKAPAADPEAANAAKARLEALTRKTALAADDEEEEDEDEG